MIHKTKNVQRILLPILLLIVALQFGFAGVSRGDVVVEIYENTAAGTVDISYSGTLDVTGLPPGDPSTGTFVQYVFSAGGAGDGGVTYINSPASALLDIYLIPNLTPISGTTMGPGIGTFTGSFSGLSVTSTGDDFAFDDGLTPTLLAVEQGFTSGSISGSSSVASSSFADFGITHGFADVVYQLPNTAGDTITFTQVPEPCSIGLFGVILVGLVSRRRRR